MYFCNMIFRHLLNMRSHPTWVRGLKQLISNILQQLKLVAPYVGAWIETDAEEAKRLESWVAPYVGAWIET